MDSTSLTQYALVNGARLRYVDQGQGPPLLLIHGLGASHADWDQQIAALSRIFRVIAPDLRGHGDSDAQGPYSVERFATDLFQLVEQLGLGAHALIGHSMGGAVAMQMAILRPERIVKLVLCNTLPSFRPRTLAQKQQLWLRLWVARLLGNARLSRITAKRMFPNPDQQVLREAVAERNGRTDSAVYLESLRALSRWSVQDKLQWLRMPSLVLASEHDYFPASEAQTFAEALPDGRYRMFEGAHHGLPMERPDEFNRTVLDFLMPGAGTAGGKGETALNWLRVDTQAVPKIDVKDLLKKV
ncbi:MAG: alpha/beta hydrolase [Stagnimonas sp.]|nr:alpha/beta hydrolase [Stagnimonas sp.]